VGLVGSGRKKVLRLTLCASVSGVSIAALTLVPNAASADVVSSAHAASEAAWTVTMPNSTQPVAAPNGGALAISCYSASSSRPPLLDLRKGGATVWGAGPSADADPCAQTAIADTTGRAYVMISTPSGWALRSYSAQGAVRWTVPVDGGPWRTDRIALGWNGSVFVQVSRGGGAAVEGFSESTGKRTFNASEYDGDGVYPYAGGVALAQPEGVEYFSYQGRVLRSVQLSALSAYEAYSATGGPDGTVFLAGWQGSCGSDKFSVSKVTPAGLSWTKTDPKQTVCGQTALSATPDGGVVLAWNQGASSWLYRKYAHSGSVRWTETPPGAPPNATSQGGYIAPIVDAAGIIGLPYAFAYPCADPSATCGAFRIDFVSGASGAEVLPPVVQQDPPANVQLDGADAGPGFLYIGATVSSDITGATSTAIEGFEVPGLSLSYRAALEPGSSPLTPFVAMGDSYSSGEGNPPFEDGTNTKRDTCHRSFQAWPFMVGVLDSRLETPVLLACSGAKTAAITSGTFKTEPPQIQQLRALREKGEIITITIGGDDAQFANVLKNCAIHDCERDGVLPAADKFIRQKLRARLVNTLAAIKSAAPKARLILVGYPNIMNPNQTNALHHCGLWLDKDEVAPLVKAGSDLNSVEQSAARAAHVEWISVFNALKGHELCTAHSWIRSLTVGGGQNRGHPLVPGQDAIAKVVSSYLVKHP
jgi:hypothetical protein